jgi:hypothetical protein
VCRAHDAGQPVAANVDGGHQIQPEQGQVGEVILGQPLTGKVGVQAAKAAKTRLANAHAFEIGQDDAACISHDYVLDIAVAVYQNSDLTIGFVG